MKRSSGQILRALRNHRGKTQLEVANFLDISRQAYSRYESSAREPNMETLSHIAKFYDVSPQVFFLDDLNKKVESDMDIVEMVALFQLKEHIDDSNSLKGIDRFITKQNKEKLKQALQTNFGFTISDKKRTFFPRRIKKIIFYIFIALLSINFTIMTIHQLDSDYEYDILNHSYVNAIAPDQNVNQTMYSQIIKVQEFDPNTIKIDDEIVIFSDFGLNEYFVETVTSINYEANFISTTYEDTTTINTPFDNVTGVYQGDANLIGTIYYASMFRNGYLLLTLGHIILLAMYYLTFIDSNKNNLKG